LEVYESNFYSSLRVAQKCLNHPNPTILCILSFYIEINEAS